MTVTTRTRQADATSIRQAIREYRIDRITDNIQHSLGIRDAVILAIIDPTVTDMEFARLVDTPQCSESRNIMSMRLTRAFASQGITDPQCICLMVCVPVYRGFVGRVIGEKLTM